MTRLPVIVGFGGINAAGRASFDHAYHRLVIETLNTPTQDATYRNLATLMNLKTDAGDPETRRFIDSHTLIRRI
ncbi:MAG: beta-ketoacyl synthase, partial [Gammaproteobacteria bacterium]